MENKLFEELCNENITVNFEGDTHVFTEGVAFYVSSESFLNGEREFKRTYDDDGAKIVIANKDTGINVCQQYEFFENVIRQKNVITNMNDDEKQLINASSAKLSVPYHGIMSWNDKRRFRLHVCKSVWSAEAHWHSGSLVDFGLNPVRVLGEGLQGPGKIIISSKGSWSTGMYYPLVILEDIEKGETYFMEHEGGVSWKITVGFQGDAIIIDCGSADIHMDGFHKTLKRDESFVTTAAVYGRVSGGFEEAVSALTKYKRAVSKRKWKTGLPPVCYNVYMGAVFGVPNEKNLKSLIPAAAKIGCEVFCIDAGWYRKPEDYSCPLGDYVPCDEVFGKDGLAGILQLIKDNNMIPGLWFEFEAAGKASECASLNGDTMLKRNGKIISEKRGFFDLNNADVRNHLLDAVDRAYKMGMRYIKNDYNNSTGIGTGSNLSEYNENERLRDKAICDFIDEIYNRYPDIIIENCGSGGMREDNGTLSHYHLQSTSDQEMYYNYPAIAASSNSIMPPEKAANWAYPYFLAEHEFLEFDKGENTDYLANRNLDGEATIFSMINGMIGVPLVSGRIDYFDDLNFKLAKEAIDCYKRIRGDIAKSYAVYPTGTALIGERSFVTAGLIDEKRTQMYLAVWKADALTDETVIDLSKYCGCDSSVKMIYPENDGKCEYVYSKALKKLTVKLSGTKYMARMFKIEL